MPYIHNEEITVDIGQLCRNGEQLPNIVDEELKATLITVLQELVGKTAIVEIREDEE